MTWIHLSSQILSNQLSCGKAEPGRHNNTVTMITQLNAGKSLNSFFFNGVPLVIKLREDISSICQSFALPMDCNWSSVGPPGLPLFSIVMANASALCAFFIFKITFDSGGSNSPRSTGLLPIKAHS